MAGKKPKISSLQSIRKELKAFQSAAKVSDKKLIDVSAKKGDKAMASLVVRSNKRQLKHFESLSKKIGGLELNFEKELKRKTKTLREKIKKLEQLKDNAAANTYLLEYKRKDLLLQSEELQNFNDEIQRKNEELLAQKEQIANEIEALRKMHEDILEKKNELEEKSNALLDQADYLEEANKIITNMHQELKQQKDEIESKNGELLNLNLEKNNLIGIVAHDLKSPLNQIKGLTSLIKMTLKDLDPETTNLLGLIEGSTHRMSDMVSKILDIEAIESKKLNLSIQRINLADILTTITDRFALEANNKQIKLHFDQPTPLYIDADAGYINQIFENLFSNAIKFSPAEKNIFIALTQQNGTVTAMVKDEGPGMTDEDKKKLFTKYQKLSARPTANESSTGLGLSIVKKFVEDMSGKIWCESEAGKGASFFVQFDRSKT
jgi:signal transduction histidine kinase